MLVDRPIQVVQAIAQRLAQSGEAVAREAMARCPVDTGRLRASIGVLLAADDMAINVGSEVEYAAYVEFGTVHLGKHNTPGREVHEGQMIYVIGSGKFYKAMWIIAPQPYLRTGLVGATQEIQAIWSR